MKSLEVSIATSTKAVTLLREETRALDSELSTLSGSLTTEQAQERVGEMPSLSTFQIIQLHDSISDRKYF